MSQTPAPSPAPAAINRLAIIGVGLIGGSLALSLRQAGYCREIVGAGRDRASLQQAQSLGVIDRFELDICAAVHGADMIVLATPVGAIESVCRALRGCLAESAVLTDVGSVKASVVDAVRIGLGHLPAGFVPAHPIAGRERSGVEAATADLYEGRRVILTPLPESDPQACQAVRRMWEVAGARVEDMPVDHHDEVLAATSHLPHLLAYTLVSSLSRLGEQEEIFRYAAGGFRDFTRIASSDPVMWRDICLHNKEAILGMFKHFARDLELLGEVIDAGDGDRLLSIFQRAKQTRDRFCERPDS
ncbi:prephenate dehydrogenase [Acidihalobacter prosperus]|uniref:prephenate dehydrogenase n=1 Tax=Acidihalobacter prosperus TaxID=160660 RepID=A0A1A6C7D7_9GAMM|nr:prephenate dehydrogenase/arogenate dehydrogenase family protein [Acidihalobacter prosperus]OBS10476.1 prephenate dehydrogenase [Acidihalobacter prosperus]